VSREKLLEARTCGFELCIGLFELALRGQHVSKTPPNLRSRLESAGMSSASASPVWPWLA
jgi:hypothetical protein